MDKEQLITQYKEGSISRQSLGMLRRIMIQETLESISQQTSEVIENILNKQKSKVDLKKLSGIVGYGIKPHNFRQSFMGEITKFQDYLRLNGHIKNIPKSQPQQSEDNTNALISFINSRLSEPDYVWPVNMKGTLFRRAIWAYFIDTPLEDVKYYGSAMSKSEVQKLLIEIDIKIANGELKTLDYSTESALDEMSNTMESKAIAMLRRELKECQKNLVAEREARLDLEKKLAFYKQKQLRLLGKGKSAIKAGSIY
ncbi:hypothetical protein [Pseudoalteromonas sp. DL-6]|uniref:hypothetical protein n=1 Tax=Pseudoalteromonas sp. DL-6 TaxID=1390185 RepID=UPI001038FB1F|nr:hypothetical protein [Pseudoalteromonas sp. DL-6]QBJ61640.1 hypothetical protein B1F84_00635 [Pseudoalteromonas sp. DL-6]